MNESFRSQPSAFICHTCHTYERVTLLSVIRFHVSYVSNMSYMPHMSHMSHTSHMSHMSHIRTSHIALGYPLPYVIHVKYVTNVTRINKSYCSQLSAITNEQEALAAVTQAMSLAGILQLLRARERESTRESERVRERERERCRERKRVCVYEYVCVCVCVCERETQAIARAGTTQLSRERVCVWERDRERG